MFVYMDCKKINYIRNDLFYRALFFLKDYNIKFFKWAPNFTKMNANQTSLQTWIGVELIHK